MVGPNKHLLKDFFVIFYSNEELIEANESYRAGLSGDICISRVSCDMTAAKSCSKSQGSRVRKLADFHILGHLADSPHHSCE